MKMQRFKLRMNRRAVSPVIATLLLIAIAVAASVVTYTWVMSMTANQSQQGQTSVKVDQVLFGRGPIKLEASTGATAAFDDSTLSEYTAHLTTNGADNEYAYVKVYPATTITLDALEEGTMPTFNYYFDTVAENDQPPALELRFTQPDGAGYVDITIFAYPGYPTTWSTTLDTWHTTTTTNIMSTYAVAYGVKADGTTTISLDASSTTLTTIKTTVETYPTATNWVLTRVTPQIGWLPATTVQDVYIADVTVDGVVYTVDDTIGVGTRAGTSGILLSIRNTGSIAATIDTAYIFEGDNLISTVDFTTVLSAGEAKNLGITDAGFGGSVWTDLKSGGASLPDPGTPVAGSAFNLVENTPYKIRLITSTGFVIEGTYYSPGSW